MKKNDFSSQEFLLVAVGIGLVIFLLSIFFYRVFFVGVSRSIEGEKVNLDTYLQSLAAGPNIERGDPLISDAKLRYPRAMLSDPQWGDKKAEVTIFVYSELLCPECIAQFQVLKAIKEKYDDKQVRLVWKGVAKSPKELLSGQASYCALVQGKFWQFVDRLMSDSGKASRLFYSDLAAELGLDVGRFNRCIDQELVLDKIYQNNQDAVDLGVDSLPYFFIEYYPYRGPLSENDLEMIIQAELSR